VKGFQNIIAYHAPLESNNFQGKGVKKCLLSLKLKQILKEMLFIAMKTNFDTLFSFLLKVFIKFKIRKISSCRMEMGCLTFVVKLNEQNRQKLFLYTTSN
jgi:hypothetical protein